MTIINVSCKLCSAWPDAERDKLRKDHFSTDYVQMPIDACDACQDEFWTAITVVAESKEEHEAYMQARRQDMAEGKRTPAYILMEQIRSRKPTKH